MLPLIDSKGPFQRFTDIGREHAKSEEVSRLGNHY